MLFITGLYSFYRNQFGVIIVPTTSPYTPTNTNIYYSASDLTCEIKGIHIISETKLLVLLYAS